jgi:hypothetical protein
VVSKVLVLRLSHYIDKLVSNSQSVHSSVNAAAFSIISSMSESGHRSHTHACLFKLNISKAFDTVCRNILLELLHYTLPLDQLAGGVVCLHLLRSPKQLPSHAMLVVSASLLLKKLMHKRTPRRPNPRYTGLEASGLRNSILFRIRNCA